MPKSDGIGVMISAMQSREFGWGMTLSEDQLKQINVKRARDVGYCDEVASKDVLGTTKKADLTESPFIRKLEYGSNKEGYWTGNHMIVQFEDCIDCLKVVYGEDYDFVFLGKYHDPENANMVTVGEKQDLNWEGDLVKDISKFFGRGGTLMRKD
mmetsp:Transcript_18080/g.31860  ORF Transcript_18080/g.31860 Transcript_18080/m.31860 type:complete len:154 (+) Transcript_18080:288-749(+)